jgi:S-adenosylmethionine hydrolase
MSVVAARAAASECWRITWRPEGLSASFHGRDLFAPVAAEIAAGASSSSHVQPLPRLDVDLSGADLREIIYVDHYGNACTGLRAAAVSRANRISMRGREISHAHVFSAVPHGDLFWYENSLGLVELAANGLSAAAMLDIEVGQPIALIA